MKRSRIHGWGLFAAVSFEVGDLVIEYVGEVIGNCISDIREKMYEVRPHSAKHTDTHRARERQKKKESALICQFGP